VWFKRADNRRVRHGQQISGWDQMRSRMVGNAEGHAMIVTFSTCVDRIRTIPFLQHDPDHFEDIYSDSEDHAGDTARYACMSRPWAKAREEKKPQDISGYAPVTPTAQPGDWRVY